MKEYRCTRCNKETPREHLTVKRVQFTTIGKNYRSLRNRTVDWLCQTCLAEDPAWNQESLSGAPSNRNIT